MFFDHLDFETFCQHFNSDQVCADALFKARWPEGFLCPACGHPHFYLTSTRRLPLYECSSCRHQTSIIAGTIMEGSKTSLPRWFQAMFLLSQPSGISASSLSEVIQVTYKTAWLIAHKIRHALQQADESELLTGIVHVNRHYYGYTLYEDARQPLLIGGSLDESDMPQHVKIKQPDPSHVSSEPDRRIGKPGIDAFVNQHTDGREVTVFPRLGKTNPVLMQITRQLYQLAERDVPRHWPQAFAGLFGRVLLPVELKAPQCPSIWRNAPLVRNDADPDLSGFDPQQAGSPRAMAHLWQQSQVERKLSESLERLMRALEP